MHLLEGAGACSEALWTAHLRLARFADGQLQGIDRYLGSPEFQAKQDLLTQSSQILDSTPSRGSRWGLSQLPSLLGSVYRCQKFSPR